MQLVLDRDVVPFPDGGERLLGHHRVEVMTSKSLRTLALTGNGGPEDAPEELASGSPRLVPPDPGEGTTLMLLEESEEVIPTCSRNTDRMGLGGDPREKRKKANQRSEFTLLVKSPRFVSKCTLLAGSPRFVPEFTLSVGSPRFVPEFTLLAKSPRFMPEFTLLAKYARFVHEFTLSASSFPEPLLGQISSQVFKPNQFISRAHARSDQLPGIQTWPVHFPSPCSVGSAPGYSNPASSFPEPLLDQISSRVFNPGQFISRAPARSD
ncbi:hypothetical protein BHM03_00006998 [Ensete ventricosum]|nr:hypothetical protein BHM03_00006998 [Ensete ventricosum]